MTVVDIWLSRLEARSIPIGRYLICFFNWPIILFKNRKCKSVLKRLRLQVESLRNMLLKFNSSDESPRTSLVYSCNHCKLEIYGSIQLALI